MTPAVHSSLHAIRSRGTLPLRPKNFRRLLIYCCIPACPAFLRGMRPCTNLSHSRTPTVKGFATIVVLRIWVVLGSSRLLSVSRPACCGPTVLNPQLIALSAPSTPVLSDGLSFSPNPVANSLICVGRPSSGHRGGAPFGLRRPATPLFPLPCSLSAFLSAFLSARRTSALP